LSIAIDVIIVLLVAFCAWRGFKSGIIRGVCGVLALVLALFGANIVATAYSGEFTGMLRPFVGGVVDKTIEGILSPGSNDEDDEDAQNPDDTDDADDTQTQPEEPEEIPEGVFDLSLATLKKLGMFESAAKLVAGKISDETDSAGYGLSGVITDKLCAAIAYIAVFGIAFILLAIIFAVLGNLLNFVFSIPGFEKLDKIIGVVFGLARGALMVLAAAVILRYVGLANSALINDTRILKYLIENNPVADVLGL
jgi:uncharacterized membrane protein required for colicin V production